MLQCVLHRRANSTVNGGINPDKDIYAIPSRYSTVRPIKLWNRKEVFKR